MKLSKKMYLSFSIIIALVIIQAALSVYDLRSIRGRVEYIADEDLPEVILADNIRYDVAMAGYHMRAFFTSLNENDYNAGAERLAALNKLFGELKSLDSRQKQLGELSGYVLAFEPNIRKYNEYCAPIRGEAATNRNARTEIDRAFKEFRNSLTALRNNFNNDLQCEDAVLNQASAMAQSGEKGILAAVADSLASIRRNLYVLLICVAALAVLAVALVIVRGIAEQIESVTEQLQLIGDTLGQKTDSIVHGVEKKSAPERKRIPARTVTRKMLPAPAS